MKHLLAVLLLLVAHVEAQTVAVEPSHRDVELGSTVRLAITEVNSDGSARTGNAVGTVVRLIRPDGTTAHSGTPTEASQGTYYFDYTPSTTGNWLVHVHATKPLTGEILPDSDAFHVTGQLNASLDALNASFQGFVTDWRAFTPQYTAQEAAESRLQTFNEMVGSLAWLLWIVAVILSRNLRPALRLAADLAMAGLLAFPMDTDLRFLLGSANTVLLIVDLFLWAKNPQTV